MLGERGLPVPAGTMGLAARQIELLHARSDVLDMQNLEGLRVLKARLARALTYARPDGLLCAFGGYADRTQVLGPMGLEAFRGSDCGGLTRCDAERALIV